MTLSSWGATDDLIALASRVSHRNLRPFLGTWL